MAQAPKYRSVWQKMLQEENVKKAAGEKSALAQGRSLLPFVDASVPFTPSPANYDFSTLPEPAPTYSPRLNYDLDGIGEPLAGPGVDDYQIDDIVENGRHSNAGAANEQHAIGEIQAQCDGTVMRGMTGWQNQQHHGPLSGMGWRTWIACNDGSRIGYGHLDTNSTLEEGTPVRVGDIVGRYGNPTNGNSSGPHVHVQQYDARGRLVAPTHGSPLVRPGHRGSRFGERTGPHRGPRYTRGHQGDDWSEN